MAKKRKTRRQKEKKSHHFEHVIASEAQRTALSTKKELKKEADAEVPGAVEKLSQEYARAQEMHKRQILKDSLFSIALSLAGVMVIVGLFLFEQSNPVFAGWAQSLLETILR